MIILFAITERRLLTPIRARLRETRAPMFSLSTLALAKLEVFVREYLRWHRISDAHPSEQFSQYPIPNVHVPSLSGMERYECYVPRNF